MKWKVGKCYIATCNWQCLGFTVDIDSRVVCQFLMCVCVW